MYGFLSTASLADVNESDLHVWQSEVPTPLRTEKGGGGGGEAVHGLHITSEHVAGAVYLLVRLGSKTQIPLGAGGLR